MPKTGYASGGATVSGRAGITYPSGQVQARSLAERIADFKANPQNWKRAAASAERATGGSARGGVSVESTYTSKLTGETIYVHDVYRPSGNQIPGHPTYRDYGKASQ
jgi:hypothetical protein